MRILKVVYMNESCPFCGEPSYRRPDWQYSCGTDSCPGGMVVCSEAAWNKRMMPLRVRTVMKLLDDMKIDYYYAQNHAMIKNVEQSLGKAYCLLKEEYNDT